MRKCKIKVTDYSDARHGTAPWHYDKNNPPWTKEYNVEAYCVGGEEGILAYFIIDDMLYTARGDDGHWWLAGVTSIHWIPEMVEAIKAINNV